MRKRWLQTIHRLAKEDTRIVFMGSDLSADPALKQYGQEIPDRFFMEGISEGHLIGMAAGIAMAGKIVFVNTIATFLTRRCYEQNAIDLGLAESNVRLLGSGGGLVYAPLGPTHLAIEDIGLMRLIPNMTVIAPADADEMQRAIEASVSYRGPIYFRVGKGGDPIVSKQEHGFTIGRPIVHREPGKAVILTYGVLLNRALAAADELAAKGITVGVIHVHTLKPLDRDFLLKHISACETVVTAEEHVISGGLGSLVAEIIAEMPTRTKPILRRLGLPDFFPDKYGSQDSLLNSCGLSVSNIVSTVLEAGQ